jgi:hypothetical protein
MIPAIREARRRSRQTTPTSEPGMCKREVRECYRISVSKSSDAAQAWLNAKHKHPCADPGMIPRGVPVFWLGGSKGHGHVAISTGSGGCWSTDILRAGFFDRVGIRLIARKWSNVGMRLVGWTEDLDGVRVWADGNPVVPRHVALLDLPADPAVVHEVDDGPDAFTIEFDTEVHP